MIKIKGALFLIALLFLAILSPLAMARRYDFGYKRYYYETRSTPTPTPTPSYNYYNYKYKRAYGTRSSYTPYTTVGAVGATTATGTAIGTSSSPIGWGLITAGGLSYIGYKVYRWTVSRSKGSNTVRECNYWKRKVNQLESRLDRFRSNYGYYGWSSGADFEEYSKLLKELRKARKKVSFYCDKGNY